jgi:hypothetical protein
MTSLRDCVQEIIFLFDNETAFTIILAAAFTPHLEQPVNRARFFDYNKKLELYFDSKDLNRFSRLKKLTKIINKQIKGNKITGFERALQLMREQDILLRDKEGPSEGMAWQGFGGVHSHYTLTPLGRSLLILELSLRCSALEFGKITLTENWDDIIDAIIKQIIDSVANKRLRIRDTTNYFQTQRAETSYVTQRIFEYIGGSLDKVSKEEVRQFVLTHAGEIHLGEIPEALEILSPLLKSDGQEFWLNSRGITVRNAYAIMLVEAALTFEETELVHYMIAAQDINNGARKILNQFALWF